MADLRSVVSSRSLHQDRPILLVLFLSHDKHRLYIRLWVCIQRGDRSLVPRPGHSDPSSMVAGAGSCAACTNTQANRLLKPPPFEVSDPPTVWPVISPLVTPEQVS